MSYPISISAKGFGLIELLAMIAIVCLIGVHIVFEYKSYLRHESMSQTYKKFIYTLSVARSNAISTRSNVAVCASIDGKNCSKISFARGWVAFIDNGNHGGVKADQVRNGGEVIIVAHQSQSAVYPIMTGLDNKELFAIGFTPKGFSSASQRVITTVSDRGRKHIYSLSSKIARSGHISGVDPQRALQAKL